MKKNSIRVVILNYNQPQLTLDCISSIQSQKYDFMDIVIIDNSSTIENYAVLESNVPQEIKLIRNNANTGYSAGNNVGIKYDKLPESEYTMILNNDVFFKDVHSINKMINAINKNIDIVALSPLVNTVAIGKPAVWQQQNRRIVDYSSCIIAYSPILRRLPILKSIANKHLNLDMLPYDKNTNYECETINGSCFIVKTDFLKDIGYLDEGTFLYFEEAILGMQVSKHKKKCMLTTAVEVDHYQGFSTKKNKDRLSVKMYIIQVKSQLYYCFKYLKSNKLTLSFLLIVRSFDLIFKYLYNLLNNIIKYLNYSKKVY